MTVRLPNAQECDGWSGLVLSVFENSVLEIVDDGCGFGSGPGMENHAVQKSRSLITRVATDYQHLALTGGAEQI